MSLTELEPALRANLNFPIEKYYPVIFMFSFDLFPAFFRQTACYPPLKNKKYPQKSFQA